MRTWHSGCSQWATNYPKHRTICDLRALHLNELAALFVHVVQLAKACGLVKRGTIAEDGTKIKADASRHKAMSYKRMREEQTALEAQIKLLLDQAQATDRAERNEPELDIPAEIERREARLSVIKAARERPEARQAELDKARGRESEDDRCPKDRDGKPKGGRYKRDFGVPEDSAQESFTDPDSRIMKRAGGGFDQSYNAHKGVDEAAQIIVAAELTNNAACADRLPELLDAFKASPDAAATLVLADTGFRSEAVFAQLAAGTTEAIVALGPETRATLKIDAEKNPHTLAMAKRLETERARAAYRRRKAIVEPPNGWIKNILGFRQFSLRGQAKVRHEFKLVCLALDPRRMSYLVPT